MLLWRSKKTDEVRVDKAAASVVDGGHAFQPPSATDSRSPCPALNTLANHGYISRDGKHISAIALLRALHSVYHISLPLAAALTLSGLLSVQHISPSLDLSALLHSAAVHNASLAVDDPPAIAPTPDPKLVDDLLAHASADGRNALSLTDLARVRVEREAREPKPLDTLHATIAEGEAALLLSVMGRKDAAQQQGVPTDWTRTFLSEHRLPVGWTPPAREEGLIQVAGGVGDVSKAMGQVRAEQQAATAEQKPKIVIESAEMPSPGTARGGGLIGMVREWLCLF